MIYIFEGVKNTCSLPGLCCKACGQCCSAINCKPIKECCDNCGTGCMHFMEKPLSTFVIVSFLLSFTQICLCNTSLSSDCEFASDASISHSMWVMIELGFAVINIVFALYFQHQVWNNILEKRDDFMSEVPQNVEVGVFGGLKGGVKNLRGQLGGTNAEPLEQLPKENSKIKVKAACVQASFKEVFLQDFGVLAYFFGLVAISVISYIGKENNKDTCSSEQVVYMLGFAFFWVAFAYTFIWYCCKCCAGTVTLEKDDMSDEMASTAGPVDYVQCTEANILHK